MKRKIALLVAGLMIFMSFSGIGVSAADEKIVIKWAVQTDNTPATQVLIDEFNRTQSKYKVEWVQMTNDSTQMKTQLMTSLSAKSSEYDVIAMDVVWAGEFAAAGYLNPLDKDMYAASLKKTQFNSGSMAAGTYMGKQYTLPFFPDLGMLYFRSDIVSKEDAAKLVSGKYTHKDLAAMAKKYKGKGGTTDGIVYQARQYEGLTCNVAEFTGGFTDIRGGLETMKFFSTSGIAPKNILNYNEAETHNSFINGKSVFARNWPYMYSMLTESVKPAQVGIAPLPKGSTVGGWVLGINKNSKNAAGAFEFMKYAAGWTGQMIMSRKGGYLPGYNVLLNDSRVLDVNPMLKIEGFKNAVKTTISRPVSAQYSKTSDAIQVNVHKYLSGGQDLNTTVKAVQNALK
ncbi:MAG TPA: extracellular solute-binding protein [Clostridia bacterium]|nr:extracellular solute-binding protein [Clostridia bacterium]